MQIRDSLAGALICVALTMAFTLEAAMAEETTDAPPAFDKLWDFQDPAATEAKFRALLPQAREAGDPDYLGQLLSQIARTRGLQRAFEDAHAVLDEAESVLTPECTEAWIRVWLERGRAFNSSDKKDKAEPLVLKAFVAAHKADGLDGLMVDAVHMLGIVGEGDSSVQWNALAIDLAEKSDDPKAKRWLGSLYNNIGWSHHDKGEFEIAVDYWKRGVTWHAERKTGRGLFIAKWAVARGLRSLGLNEEALAQQKALLAEYDAAGVEEAGYCAEEIGELLLAVDKADEAKPWFAKAHAKLSKDAWLQANEAERLARMKKLAGEADGDDG